MKKVAEIAKLVKDDLLQIKKEHKLLQRSEPLKLLKRKVGAPCKNLQKIRKSTLPIRVK